MSSSTPDPALVAEQEHVTGLYARLDAARELAVRRREQAISAPLVDNAQAMGEKEAAVRFHGTRIVQLDAAEAGLVLGRLDREDVAQPLYVGRTGLPADDAGGDPALVDWRAPASRPFYTATPFRPEGVSRRRHIRTLGRRVTGIDDEVLVLAEGEEADEHGLTGEAALLRALTADRTGRMTDIVRTIQAEQDQIIRSDSRGVLVVQGGPGTGKTAVALHRAAYLLYTHRDRLARSGLLVVGPTPTFLRYIADVLPALGETGVLLAGLGQLRPGLDARAEDPADVAEVKGRLSMVDVVAAAVKDRQGVLRGTREVVVDRERIRLRAGDVARVRTQARRASRLHNLARPAFYRGLVDLIAQRVADRMASDVRGGEDLLDAEDRRALRREIAGEPAVADLVEELWPLLTPEELLRDLYASPARIAAATKGWSEEDRALLVREADASWTVADVPLLEEADELLGVDDSAERAAAQRRRQAGLDDAQRTLDLLHGSRSHDADDDEESEELTAGDLLDAEGLAAREEEADYRSTAERAAADRTWTFGHVVVDEAQELSAMAWRVLARKCPTLSMTVVGDLAQTGSAAGASSWAEVLTPHARTQWRMAQLTVNYRTPTEIMEVAADVLAASGSQLEAPRSVRSAGEFPAVELLTEAELTDRVAAVTADLAGKSGTTAVIAPVSRFDDVVAALTAALPAVTSGGAADSSAGPVVLRPHEAKGLEFDSVVLVEPARVLSEGTRGSSDLYVALTRATQRLAVLHTEPLPESMHRLQG
ncbi:AAA family ATPase [Modestobacter sp. Leaf380]|uniref:HelD family protein n=1 Tax=Modestobacter sp. Leaf380 TaxID=1736356 RepID=UPI0006F86C92|nr:AAA family ATPase [Modestobacter sp. Leaf380]KQS71150.1 helicase [Modestobacter sp. Leaf380]